MSNARTKRFCVRFMATSCYKAVLRAKSPKQAVAKAQKLWAAKGATPFTCFAGDTEAWDAERE